LDTQDWDRGSHLSGGQKQIIAIARAIIKNPSILILDEAISALDSESERLVQDALMLGRTSFVIAHSLSADKTLVIQHGTIIETGTHDELILKNGVGQRKQVRQFIGNEQIK
jgi:subfamily B ATP-binding cassette protein MsbA